MHQSWIQAAPLLELGIPETQPLTLGLKLSSLRPEILAGSWATKRFTVRSQQEKLKSLGATLSHRDLKFFNSQSTILVVLGQAKALFA